MNSLFEEVQVIEKKSEDKVSTNNPNKKLPCEKKILTTYMAKKKDVMVMIEGTLKRQKVQENYQNLISLMIADKHRLPLPSELPKGAIVDMKYRVHIVKKGDTLSSIVSSPNCDISSWQELADLNNINPNKLKIGQFIVVPLKKDQYVTLEKDVLYQKSPEPVIGDCVHIVTEVEGFKKGESVTSKIEEEANKVTKTEELLSVLQHGKEKTEFIANIEEDKEDPTKGKAISEEIELLAISETNSTNVHEMLNFSLKDKNGKAVNYKMFDTSKEEVEKKETVKEGEKNWQENLETSDDKNVTLKIKTSSPSLPNEEVESEEHKLVKRREFKMFYDELSKVQLDKEDWQVLASYELLDSEKVEDLKEKYKLEKKKFEPIDELSKFHDELSKVHLDEEDQHVLASYELLDPKKRESLRKKYKIGEEKLEIAKDPITLEPFPSDACEDDVYYDNLENTSACEGKYDVNPMITPLNNIPKKEEPWTVILGFSYSIDSGVSGTFEAGVFRSKVIQEDGTVKYFRGEYWAVESGAGVTKSGEDHGLISTTGHSNAPYEAYLQGFYQNSGVNISRGFEVGVSKITTFTKPMYHGFTVDAGWGKPNIGGHLTVGFGDTFWEKEMKEDWTWKDIEKQKDRPKNFTKLIKDTLEKIENFKKEKGIEYV